MAITGFWPVKSALKDVIEYARNPDKTTDKRFMDNDLANAIEYASDDSKTDQKMFVSAINCPKQRAYEQMMATKRHFGKLGGNVAYHGFQSFESGEVTANEAHKIGLSTARKMWGDEYEIVVTTHLNTDNIHNHIVVNSVSFKTGRKFENHISDHHKLREISDKVCKEYGKSILENSNFYGGNKKEYWVRKNGGKPQKDILKDDIEECLKYSRTGEDFENRLRAFGYKLARTNDQYSHLTVQAKDWKRPKRLDTLGYTKEVINKRLNEHRTDIYFFQIQNNNPRYRPKAFPLLALEKQLGYEITHSNDTVVVLVDLIFYILLQLLLLTRDETAKQNRCQPLSPSVRLELAKLDQLQKEYLLLAENNIHSVQELSSFIGDISGQIKAIEDEHQGYRNQICRCQSPEKETVLKDKCKDLSAKAKPLRDKLRTANSIVKRYPKLQELLKTEREMEVSAQKSERNRGYER